MHQWDVFDNPSLRLRDAMPYVVLVQSDLLSHLDTRWVAPLVRVASPKRATAPSRLMPLLNIAGESCLLLPQQTAPVLARALGKPVANLRADSHRIVDALDAVIGGV